MSLSQHLLLLLRKRAVLWEEDLPLLSWAVAVKALIAQSTLNGWIIWKFQVLLL